MSLRGDKRTEFPQSVKKAAFVRCCKGGTKPGIPQCENCGIELNVRTGTIYEHLDADGLGGEPTLKNCGVFCFTCADIKTHTEDNPRMAKADRGARKNHGLQKKAKHPMPGSKASGFKRKMDGSVVKR